MAAAAAAVAAETDDERQQRVVLSAMGPWSAFARRKPPVSMSEKEARTPEPGSRDASPRVRTGPGPGVESGARRRSTERTSAPSHASLSGAGVTVPAAAVAGSETGRPTLALDARSPARGVGPIDNSPSGVDSESSDDSYLPSEAKIDAHVIAAAITLPYAHIAAPQGPRRARVGPVHA